MNWAAPSGAKTLLLYHAGDGINIICAVRTAKAPLPILGSGAWDLAVLKMVSRRGFGCVSRLERGHPEARPGGVCRDYTSAYGAAPGIVAAWAGVTPTT